MRKEIELSLSAECHVKNGFTTGANIKTVLMRISSVGVLNKPLVRLYFRSVCKAKSQM